ncbi:hypothetical protein [Paludibaculum fermentans]|uniref:Small multidrug resistance family-3 protein n=1 Tax=Paludibaculum fermentans TaxID=1473598 RepID=A0A7S7SI32_PALFE|nr:hypothetical protein [Paludibaculum fermentans]QOY85011.1 hypothetical protein IRI77_19370 [Paludibaculum fermentans]
MSFPLLSREPGPVLTYLVLAAAAFLEAFGDSCFQSALYRSTGPARFLAAGFGVLALAAYGFTVNLPRWDFGRLLGIYVVFFFLCAQLLAWLRFDQRPSLPVCLGGVLIVAGGCVISFWRV